MHGSIIHIKGMGSISGAGVVGGPIVNVKWAGQHQWGRRGGQALCARQGGGAPKHSRGWDTGQQWSHSSSGKEGCVGHTAGWQGYMCRAARWWQREGAKGMGVQSSNACGR